MFVEFFCCPLYLNTKWRKSHQVADSEFHRFRYLFVFMMSHRFSRTRVT